jgi:hypothetical protein
MEFSITADGDMVRARAWGRDTQTPPSQVCAAILAEANRLGLKRILVELTQKVPLSSASQYLLVEKLPSLGATPLHRIALVHHTPGFVEANEMIGLAAGNRGLNVKNFGNLESALAWLALGV